MNPETQHTRTVELEICHIMDAKTFSRFYRDQSVADWQTNHFGECGYAVHPIPVQVYSNSQNKFVDATLIGFAVNQSGKMTFCVRYPKDISRGQLSEKIISKKQLEEWNDCTYVTRDASEDCQIDKEDGEQPWRSAEFASILGEICQTSRKIATLLSQNPVAKRYTITVQYAQHKQGAHLIETPIPVQFFNRQLQCFCRGEIIGVNIRHEKDHSFTCRSYLIQCDNETYTIQADEYNFLEQWNNCYFDLNTSQLNVY
jgi:hypothetical protein